MQTVKIHGKIDSKGHLKLDIPTGLDAGEVDIVLVIESNTKSGNKYDFSDLVGTLHWDGDALATQKALRDEW